MAATYNDLKWFEIRIHKNGYPTIMYVLASDINDIKKYTAIEETILENIRLIGTTDNLPILIPKNPIDINKNISVDELPKLWSVTYSDWITPTQGHIFSKIVVMANNSTDADLCARSTGITPTVNSLCGVPVKLNIETWDRKNQLILTPEYIEKRKIEKKESDMKELDRLYKQKALIENRISSLLKKPS